MSARELKVWTHAKLNLFLEVLGRRADGYHELLTVMQAISLRDFMRVERAPSGVQVTTDDPRLPGDLDNLAGRGADRVLEALGRPGGVRIHIEKGIPIGAGLGGGSSDAAAAMVATNILYDDRISHSDLDSLAAEIGSDVAFFLSDGGTALCAGRGERIEDTAPGPEDESIAILFCPPFQVSTASVYRGLSPDPRGPLRDARAFWAAYREGGRPADLSGLLYNRLEEAACAVEPRLAAVRDGLKEHWPDLQMSGSGSTFYSPRGPMPRGPLRVAGMDIQVFESLSEQHKIEWTRVR